MLFLYKSCSQLFRAVVFLSLLFNFTLRLQEERQRLHAELQQISQHNAELTVTLQKYVSEVYCVLPSIYAVCTRRVQARLANKHSSFSNFKSRAAVAFTRCVCFFPFLLSVSTMVH